MKVMPSFSAICLDEARWDLACVGRLAPPSWPRSPLGLVPCIAYVFQWGYDGKQHSMVSLGTTSRLPGNQ